jgi:hypothetical protein
MSSDAPALPAGLPAKPRRLEALARHWRSLGWTRLATGFLVSVAMFVGLGTVSALWSNPLFVRMTAAGWWEILALLLTALLAGLFVVLRREGCSVATAQGGGILGFLGVACPTCNKLLMLIFGGQALLTYYDPIRPLVASLGVAVLGMAVLREAARHVQLPQPDRLPPA